MSSSSSLVSALPKNIDVFTIGEHTIANVEVKKTPIGYPLWIYTPSEAGEYPVVVLLHGYFLYNYYVQLSRHVASHGYILVVPQLYVWAGPNATKDVESVAAITNWLPQGLQKNLPPKVTANLTNLVLAGHSRGGKAAFALILKRVETQLSLKYCGLIGIDPVDGLSESNQTIPKVLTYKPNSFDLEMPVMVIGSGLGDCKQILIPLACAPKGVNYVNFYDECRKPACYFVAKDYGHLDVLDDNTNGLRGFLTHCLCKNGKSREPMRRFVGGAMVAFLIACLDKDCSYLEAIKDTTPIVLEKVAV